jgi:phenylpropionate dioxygenase-like ring-hydroxylating dioxygenase large terminal subunit
VAPFVPKVAERWSEATAEHTGGDFQFYFLWPNMFFIGGVRGGRAGMTRVVPVGPRESKFVTRSYNRPAENEEYIAAFDRMLDETLAEDIAVCERVQTGLRSGMYEWGYTLPKSEQNMRHIYRMVWDTLSPAFR